jgi:uncharacterized protein with HEPN domain
MKRDSNIYLTDILDSIIKIEQYLVSISETEFFANQEKQDAVIRRLEIIGEAVKKLPMQLRDENPEIPWKQIAGMRDVIIHEYFEVSLETVWRTLKNDLPDIKSKLERMMKSF